MAGTQVLTGVSASIRRKKSAGEYQAAFTEIISIRLSVVGNNTKQRRKLEPRPAAAKGADVSIASPISSNAFTLIESVCALLSLYKRLSGMFCPKQLSCNNNTCISITAKDMIVKFSYRKCNIHRGWHSDL